MALVVAAIVAGSSAVVMPTPHARRIICPFITASSPQTLSTTPPPVPLNPCPGVVMGTYLGGKFLDSVTDVAVDPSGNVYVTGSTNSSDFPTTPGAHDTVWEHPEGIEEADAFVAKFAPSGTLVYSTFLGGRYGDWAASIAVDATGNAFVAGTTASCDFPTTPGAYDTSFGGCLNTDTLRGSAFVTKFDSSGALVYSTLLADNTTARSVSVDASGDAYVTGVTWSPDFPTTPGAYVARGSEGDRGDVFVARLNPEGSELTLAAVVGGESFEDVRDGVVDPFGGFYAIGYTDSERFPVTEGALKSHIDNSSGPTDAFVFRLNPDGTDLVFSTYLGGNSRDAAWGLAIDSTGVANIVGTTSSQDFPRTPDAINTTIDGRGTFVVGMDRSGTLLYSALLGSAQGFGIYVDEIGQIYLTGETESEAFLTTSGAYDATYNGGGDAFLVGLAPAGTALLYASYLGGGDEVLYTDIPGGYDRGVCAPFCGDVGYSVFFDQTGNATVVGTTGSADFPTTTGAHDTTFHGLLDVFVVRMEPIPDPNRAPVAHFRGTFPPDNDARVDVDAQGSADAEDRDELLEVRWDWEDDDIWDTEWSFVKTASHEYTWGGTYTIRLEARDTVGLTGNTTRQVHREALPPQVSGWANMSSGTHPARRFHDAMAYDSESDRVILFGGVRYPDPPLDDTWSYDFNTNAWTNMDPPTLPTARSNHMVAYDAESDRIIVFGGRLPDRTLSADTWAYDFNTNTWTHRSPAVHPSPRNDAAMAYDAQSDRVILVGGYTAAGRSDETWAYDFNTNTWTNMNPNLRPPPRFEAAMAYDRESDRAILFGGNVDDSGMPFADDTWAYDFNANSWVERNPPKKPSAQGGHAMAYDSGSDRLVLHGRAGSYPVLVAATWLYDFNSDAWVGAAPAASAPLLWSHAIAYDSESDRVVLFGGEFLDPPYEPTDETWVYRHEFTSFVTVQIPPRGPDFATAGLTATAIVGIITGVVLFVRRRSRRGRASE